MRLSRANIDRMPRQTSRQERQRNAALKGLKKAEELEQALEGRFADTIRLDGTSYDRNDAKGIYAHATERSETLSVNKDGARNMYERKPGEWASFARQRAFSTLYATSETTVTNRLEEQGDRTVYTSRKTYDHSECPYPNETTTVIKYESAEGPEYKVYDGWIPSKLAQFGIL